MVEPRILVIGNANVDLTTYVDSFPLEGETVLGTGFNIGMGGKGANQAVACSRAGSPTALIGAIGHDTFGDVMWDGLSAESLSLDHLKRVDTPSGAATIMVEPSGANRIAVFAGASATLTAQNTIDAIAHAPQSGFLVSQLEIPVEVVSGSIQHAKQQGLTTVLNVAPYCSLPSDLLTATDWIIANEGEAQALLDDAGITATVEENVESVRGQISNWATALGMNLVITLGGEGAVGVKVGDNSFSTQAPPVSAVDTVGAGDCFTGYFVALLDQGFTWQQALNGAVHAASHSVQYPGAQSSYPARDQADQFATLAASIT
jgi:ribokinase